MLPFALLFASSRWATSPTTCSAILIVFAFDILLLALLLHQQTRTYQRIWFRVSVHDRPMTTTVQGIAGLKELVGQHLGYSDYMEITQERVNLFADATGDHQWIHVDVERANAESPFGGPIAHGYLTLSLGPVLVPQVIRVEGIKMGVNYGCEKVRFPSPVPVGAKLRVGVELLEVTDIPGGCQVQMRFTFECEGAPKPSCVSENLFRYYE